MAHSVVVHHPDPHVVADAVVAADAAVGGRVHHREAVVVAVVVAVAAHVHQLRLEPVVPGERHARRADVDVAPVAVAVAVIAARPVDRHVATGRGCEPHRVAAPAALGHGQPAVERGAGREDQAPGMVVVDHFHRRITAAHLHVVVVRGHQAHRDGAVSPPAAVIRRGNLVYLRRAVPPGVDGHRLRALVAGRHEILPLARVLGDLKGDRQLLGRGPVRADRHREGRRGPLDHRGVAAARLSGHVLAVAGDREPRKASGVLVVVLDVHVGGGRRANGDAGGERGRHDVQPELLRNLLTGILHGADRPRAAGLVARYRDRDPLVNEVDVLSRRRDPERNEFHRRVRPAGRGQHHLHLRRLALPHSVVRRREGDGLRGGRGGESEQ